MQMREANQLSNAWKEKGSPRCSHPSLVKEYHLSAQTGDVMCTTCGECWWHNDPERPDRKGR